MTTLDFIDDVDELQLENDNKLAYYRGRADGFKMMTEMACKAKDMKAVEDWLTCYRQTLIQDKKDLDYEDNWVEEEECFICGELDAINEARDLLSTKKEK